MPEGISEPIMEINAATSQQYAEALLRLLLPKEISQISNDFNQCPRNHIAATHMQCSPTVTKVISSKVINRQNQVFFYIIWQYKVLARKMIILDKK